MLEPHQIHDLPLRQRPVGDEAEQDHDFESSSSDDDLEHISRPGSVRSLNTPSPSSSPLLVPATEGDSTAVSSLTLQVSDTLPQPLQISEGQHQAEHDLPAHDVSTASNDILPRATPQTQVPSSLTSYNHASLDQEIMDHLIEHALTARIEQEYGHGSSKDQKLRQQMMTRFRSLPAEHSLFKGSISQLDGSKALFQGQQRSSAELEYVYRFIFTDLERMALSFLIGCHTRHFENACHLCVPSTEVDRAQSSHAMGHVREREGRRLANQIQADLLKTLDMRRPVTELYSDLRRRTRSKINTHLRLRYHDAPVEPVIPSNSDDMSTVSDWRAQRASDPKHQLKNMRTVFYTTIADSMLSEHLPYDPYDKRSTVTSTAAKREPPEDDIEPNSTCLSPPLKKFQLDLRGQQPMKSEAKPMLESSVGDAQQVGSSTILKHWGGQPKHSESAPYEWAGQPYQKVGIDTEDVDVVQQYHLQLMRFEQQNEKRLLEARERSSAHEAEKLDKRSHMSEAALMEAQMQRLRENQSRIMASMGLPKPVWPSKLADSPSLNDHFSAQSRNALAGAEGPPREYRQDTLLARSTQLPIPSAGITSIEKSSSWGPDSPHIDSESVHDSGGSTDSKTRSGYSFAPAFQPDESSKTINEWKAQMILLEENREKKRQAAKENARVLQERQLQLMFSEQPKSEHEKRKALENADKSKPKLLSIAPCFPDPPNDRQEVLPTKTCHRSPQKLTVQTQPLVPDYQKQLMLLEQQNRFRLMRQREEEQRRQSRGDGSKNDHGGSQPVQDHLIFPESHEAKVRENAAYKQQLAMLEEANKTRLMLLKEEQQRQKSQGGSNDTIHSSKQNVQDRPVPIGTQVLGAMTLDEFQKYLMEQERVNRSRLQSSREEQARKDRVCKTWFGTAPVHRAPSKESQPAFPELVRKDSNGVSWMAFGYKRDGVPMEYTVRLDVESVDTDTLPWFFKDQNCLHESCKGWMSTAERTRQAQTAYLERDHEPKAKPAERTWKQGGDSTYILGQRERENRVAWSLAQLNPCLRVTGGRSKELLRTAVKHYFGPRTSTVSAKREPRVLLVLPGPNTSDAHKSPNKDPFVCQSPDDIMNDAYLEESSSEEDDDEDCSYVPEEPAPDSDFPTAFFDDKNIRYLTFEFHTASTSTTGYYTVRADAAVIKPTPRPRLFTHDECICFEDWKQQQAETLTHCRDCNVALALGVINPILRGKKKEKLRWAAMTNYMFMEILEKWPSNPGDGENDSYGGRRVLNPEVTQTEVDNGFVLFIRGPPIYGPGPCAQCNYCNLIVDGMGYGNRVTHLARCDGFARKGEIRMDC